MGAKQQALQDIKSELKSEGRSFIMFYKELDVPIRDLVKQYLKQQKELSKKK